MGIGMSEVLVGWEITGVEQGTNHWVSKATRLYTAATVLNPMELKSLMAVAPNLPGLAALAEVGKMFETVTPPNGKG
jgi:hypothetical protein